MAVESILKIPSTIRPLMIVGIVVIAMTKPANTIVVPSEKSFLVKNHDYRNFIPPETKEYPKSHEVRKMIPCLLSFVESFLFLQPSRIPVLLPENLPDFSQLSHVYLAALQNIRSTYVFRGHLDSTSDQINTRSGMIVIPDSLELSNISFELVDLCGRDCRYLVIITQIFDNEETFLEESNRLVQLLWNHRVANTAFLGVVRHEVLISRSLSFVPHVGTQPSSPVLVAECDEETNWSLSRWNVTNEIYSPLAMNESIVRIVFFDNLPYVTSCKDEKDNSARLSVSSPPNSTDQYSIDADDAGTNDRNDEATNATLGKRVYSKLAGFEGLIINALASALHFSIAAEEIPWTQRDKSSAEVNDALWGKGRELVDMVLGGLPWAPEEETIYTLPYENVQVIWLTPIRPNVSLRGLIAPFEMNVWFAVIGLLIFASTVEFVITRNVAFLEMLSLVIGIAWPSQPKVLSARIRFMSWVIFGYVLTQFYLASLAGQLMASSDRQIESMRELAESTYEVGGAASVLKYFHHSNDTTFVDENEDDLYSDNVNYDIEKRFRVFAHEEYAKRFNDLIETRNTSLVLAVKMNISSMKPSFQGKHVHRMKETLTSYPVSFAVWRGMPYLSTLDRKISDLIEGGIIAFWARNISRESHGYFDNDVDESESILDLTDLAPGFLLLVMGYGLSGIFLLIEIVVFGWKTGSPRAERLPGKSFKALVGKDGSIQEKNTTFKINGKDRRRMVGGKDPWILRSNDYHKLGNKNVNPNRARFPTDLVH